MYEGETSFQCSILKLQRTLIRKTVQQELSSAAVQCDPEVLQEAGAKPWLHRVGWPRPELSRPVTAVKNVSSASESCESQGSSSTCPAKGANAVLGAPLHP